MTRRVQLVSAHAMTCRARIRTGASTISPSTNMGPPPALGRQHAPGPIQKRRIGRKARAGQRHLVGMDQELAAKPDLDRMRAIALQLIRIAHRRGHPVQWGCNPGKARGKDNPEPGLQQRRLGVPQAQIDGKVDRTESSLQGLCRDLLGTGQTARGFNQRDYGQSGALPDTPHRSRRLGLWQHDRCKGETAGQIKVRSMVAIAFAVDPQTNWKAPFQPRQGARQGLSCRSLAVAGDRILKVGQNRIGARGHGLGQSVGPIGRHKKQERES